MDKITVNIAKFNDYFCMISFIFVYNLFSLEVIMYQVINGVIRLLGILGNIIIAGVLLQLCSLDYPERWKF